MEKGFFYGSFTPPVSTSTVQQLFLRSLSSLVLTFRSSAPVLDVLKGHVKYSGGIFITVLSGNACGLISLSARGVKQSGLRRGESNVFGCQCVPFLNSFWLQEEYCIIFIKFVHTRVLFNVIIRKMPFFAACAFVVQCSSNAKLIPTVVNGWFSSKLFHLNWLSSEVSK